MDAYYRHDNANIHRGIYQLSERATAAYEGAREQVARLINAPDPRTIVWTRNATESVNLVAYSWGRRHIERGDAIILTEMEHHANLVPWQILAQEKDADLEFIPITDDGILRQDVFDVLLRLKPKLVAFTHVSNMLGTINPVVEMTRRAPRGRRARADRWRPGGAAHPGGCAGDRLWLLRVLGAQGAGSHRLRGPVGPPRAPGGDAPNHGWRRHDPRGAPAPERVERGPLEVEAGTPTSRPRSGWVSPRTTCLALAWTVYASTSASSFLRAQVLPREVPGSSCADRARSSAAAWSRSTCRASTRTTWPRCSTASGWGRAGHHCTMPLHERLDLTATARASFQVYNTREDVDALVTGLGEVQRLFGV